MKRTASCRFVSDICFFYAILSIFPFTLPMQKAMALFTAGSFAAALAAEYCPRAPLRFLLALLPGTAFLLAPLRFPLVFPALAWLYLILVLTPGRFHIWLEGYRRSFRIMLALSLSALIFSILLNMIKPGTMLILPGLYYLLAFLCLGVLAMRRMQVNTAMGFRWNLANGAAVVGIPLLAFGCSLLLWQLLHLLRPAAVSLLPLIRRLIAWLVNTLFPIHPEVPEPTPTPKPTLTPAEEAITEPGWETPAPEIRFGWEPDPALLEKAGRIGICILLALLVLALMLLILRHARRGRAKPLQEESVQEGAEKASPVRRRKAGKAAAVSTNARQVRILYRKYMLLMRRQGVRIRKDNTSREILDEAEPLNASPAAERLRALYLKARYGDGSLVTREDVQEASLCLKEIREDKERKDRTRSV